MVNINTSVNFIAIRDSKVLLIRRTSSDKIEPSKWSIPGGKCEVGETVEAALRREILEELGVEVSGFKYFRSYYFKNNPEQHTRALYFYGNIGGKVVLNEESSECKWFDLKGFSNTLAFNQDEVIRDFKSFIN